LLAGLIVTGKIWPRCSAPQGDPELRGS